MHSSSVPSTIKYGRAPREALMRSLLSDGHFLRVAGASKLIWASLSGMFSVSPSFSSQSSYEVSSPFSSLYSQGNRAFLQRAECLGVGLRKGWRRPARLCVTGGGSVIQTGRELEDRKSTRLNSS